MNSSNKEELAARLAQAEENVARLTRSTAAATGALPGPALALPSRGNGKKTATKETVMETVEELDEGDEDGQPVDYDLLLAEELIGSDEEDGSYQPEESGSKGKGRAASVEEEESAMSEAEGDEMIRMQGEIAELYSKHEWSKGAALLAYYSDTFLQEPRNERGSAPRNPTPGPSVRRNLVQQAAPNPSPPQQREKTPTPEEVDTLAETNRAGVSRRSPYTLIQENLSNAVSDIPQTSRHRQMPGRPPSPPSSHDSSPSRGGRPTLPPPRQNQSPTPPLSRRRNSPASRREPVDEPRAGRDQVPADRPRDVTRQEREAAGLDAGNSEEELAKAMLESGKGRMVLSNGDVIENGRRILNDDSEQMERILTPLSQVLQVWLKTFKAYIPLTVFNKRWLREDQKEWEVKEPQTEAKILKGGANVKAYGGKPPPEELLMQFEEWLDSMKLFVRYVEEAGWVTQAERFRSHMDIVMDLRDNTGWMVALRYCRRIRQGVMRVTVDQKICNISKLQVRILDEVKQVCENLGERAYQTNPHAPGGPKDHIDPESGLARSSSSTSNAKKGQPTEAANYELSRKPKRKWLPDDEWEAKKKAERAARNSKREDWGKAAGRYAEKANWRDEKRRDRSRSRSRDRGGQGYRYGGKSGKGRY
ncbi:uncharacterized protein MELLADRAFT_95551 [Melampsora larici-populina 98AG31]|uniref:Uncharacterized protein n=1 Tax=Melampsora larici-populina (strain 98AG31 / pathotype 3-4-7) TaxID=747676 RepID=F4S9R5_MELLP|nr:uncharacterized protein MELLADRAFT_95551 [Melampsora larici-populina 98AG31]EGF98622.1 hypothetical protein MELLADRAFT_95551 [Melampsora larici-populina 98AG31]